MRLSTAIVILVAAAGVQTGTRAEGPIDTLIEASMNDDVVAIERLLAGGVKATAANDEGLTPLMGAAFGGARRAAALLLAQGADVNAKDKDGRTALMMAALKCRVGLTRLLWEAGANGVDTDHAGNSVEAYAIVGGCRSLLRATAASECKDMSSLYTQVQLERAAPALRRQVSTAWGQVVRQTEPPGARARLQKASISTPLTPAKCLEPFYFVTHLGTGTIELPILSLKFVHDLLAANWWALKRGYEPKGILYVTMLKYRRARDFQGGRFPTPLDALGIPRTGDGEYDARDLRRDIEDRFAVVLLFIAAHEAGHLLLNHERSTPERETLADTFALDIMARNHIWPEAAGEFLRFATYWSPTAGEFEDVYQYLTWLRVEATHPSTAARIKLLGTAMQEDANKYFPGQPVADPEVQAAKQAGAKMRESADLIELYTSFPDFFSGALKTDLSTLALVRRAQ